ncbi:hypothetical protein AB6A40_008621 [Gnathostoma spinigerum]|uniref:Uncharacterized protein n=1 Tax=Gnathostoma spinigerum TaxID=75299 RepID=A0ABD6ERZ0_9BILA
MQGQKLSLAIVIISQDSAFDRQLSNLLLSSLIISSKADGLEPIVYISNVDFSEVTGSWALWPMFESLVFNFLFPFVFFSVKLFLR